MSIGGILPSYPAWMTPENRYYEGQQQQQDGYRLARLRQPDNHLRHSTYRER